MEGLATLFEASEITAGGLSPQLDSRLTTLQKAFKDKKNIPLQQLVKMDRTAFMQDPLLCYAEARYVMYYMHDKGQLKAWYDAYKAGFADDATGMRAMEKVLGKKIFEIEDDWAKWVAGLKLATNRLADQGRLGVEVQDAPAGVVVLSLVPSGPAAKAGRIKPGDVIEKIDTREVRSCADFVAAVRASAAMQTVNIQVFREGRHVTLAQPLGQK